jgi:DNA-binding FrmR family transcriptional regulator
MTETLIKPTGASVWRYLKEAFLFKWNLAGFLGAAAFGILSPSPDIALPLIAAVELTYLVGLTTIPRFRAAIDAKAHAEKKGVLVSGPGARTSVATLGGIVQGLSPKARQRFQVLRDRCVAMQSIAQGVHGSAGPTGGEDLRTPALDRLLWVFLRLLSSQQALERFLAATDATALKGQLEGLRKRAAAAKERAEERLLRSLTDSIATAELRLDNYGKAASNAEFVGVELERIEGKIQALSEMAVSHQDPDYITSQVDSVAESMAHTEEAIRELNAITGLSSDMAAPPPILDADLETAVER